MKQIDLLAFDIGASNSRAILGRFDGKKLTLSELHRFENKFKISGNLFFWNVTGLFGRLKESFAAYKASGGKNSSHLVLIRGVWISVCLIKTEI